MNKATRTLLAAVLGISAVLGAGTPAAATELAESPAGGAAGMTEWATFDEAPVYTAKAPGTALGPDSIFVLEEVVSGDGRDRAYPVSEPYTAADGSQWRAVDRWWMNEEQGLISAMYVPVESIKQILTREEYLAAEAVSLPGQDPSSSPFPSPASAAEGPRAAAPASEQAAAQEQAGVQTAAQEVVQEDGSNFPAIAGVTVGVLLVGGIAVYLVARRRNRSGTTDSVV